MKYRKKPFVIEAYRTDKEIVIHTLEGDMKANVGDYIIISVNGEQYPCKPDIFEKTYEIYREDKTELNNIIKNAQGSIENRINAAYNLGRREGYKEQELCEEVRLNDNDNLYL